LHFIEQPHVLDRDHGLVGKGGDQLDLLGGERSHGLTLQVNYANRCSLPQEGHAEHGPRATDLPPPEGVFRIGRHIVDMNRSALQHDATDQGASAGWNLMFVHVSFVGGRIAVARDLLKGLTLRLVDGCLIRLAQPRRRLH
jgi:hypothetical protein